ncbi:YfhO family protein [Facklamia sp. P12955]|uniref:YfhO family protein n=1 Tax=Facklamia sp. P12955 TaxID=3421946 RepID=UPI003D180CEB
MKKKTWIYGMSGLAPLALMLVGWFINDFFPFGEKSFLAIDFNQQFIDLYIFMRNSFYSGDFGALFYSFTKSIGGNMIGAWAYYLMSPFNIFYLILPMKWITYAIFLSVWLRYGAMGLSMAYYLIKRHGGQKRPYLTLILATTYSLNGFAVSYQMTPIFMDALWLMPLLLVALENVLDGKKPYTYIFLLASTMIIQYYMGYMICLFILFYSFYYLFVQYYQVHKDHYFKFLGQNVVRLGMFSLIGIGLSALLLVPNIYNLLFSKAALESTLSFDWELQINPLDIFAKLMIGAFDNESWSAGPNLPNIYVGSLAMVGVISYFLSKTIKTSHKWASATVLTIFFFSMTHEFTSKIWHMGQNPAGFFYRFSWILVFFLILLAYQGLKDKVIESQEVFIGIAIALLIQSVVMVKEYSFLTPEQRQASAFIFGLMWLVLYLVKQPHFKWLLVLLLSFGELSANAYLSQGRLNHNNAFKFENALDVIDESIDKIRPDKSDFYRISKTFYRSKNDPMTFSYPGMTTFTSSLEGSTRDLFEELGNSAIDASIYYYGTPLTDALFGVKYFVNNEPFSSDDQAVIDQTYIFPTDVTRLDITNEANKVDETDRFTIFQTPKTLPIAFGVSNQLAQLNLIENRPIANQNAIAQALLSDDTEIFKLVETEVTLTNLIHGATQSGGQIFSREDNTLDGSMKLIFTPTTDDSYFVDIPRSLSTYKGEVDILLNGQNYDYRSKFGANQVFNIAHQAKGQEQELEIIIKADRQFNLTDLKIYQMDQNKVNQIIEDRQSEAIQIEEWGSNYVRGSITIKDSPWVFTSIPYDQGWQVKVDGELVEDEKIWDSLLAFQVEAGEHQLEMIFQPRGLLLGAGITSLSALSLIAWALLEQKYGKFLMFHLNGESLNKRQIGRSAKKSPTDQQVERFKITKDPTNDIKVEE